MPEVRGGSREEQPHVQGAVAAQALEGLEELLHRKEELKWEVQRRLLGGGNEGPSAPGWGRQHHSQRDKIRHFTGETNMWP